MAGLCAQIGVSPERYVAELPSVLSAARTERATVETYTVRFKFSRTRTYQTLQFGIRLPD